MTRQLQQHLIAFWLCCNMDAMPGFDLEVVLFFVLIKLRIYLIYSSSNSSYDFRKLDFFVNTMFKISSRGHTFL